VAKPVEPPSVPTATPGPDAPASTGSGNAPAAVVIAPMQQKLADNAKPSGSAAAAPNSARAKSPKLTATVKGPEPAPPGAASVPVKPALPPPLDLSSLEERLRETRAIGVFTKLSLKNQVDDLLAAFRAYYGGTLRVPLAELRQRYNLLLLKVLTLLQDGDPGLAAAITTSKEAIWSILADPQKFGSL
jgi:hypothetical protein